MNDKNDNVGKVIAAVHDLQKAGVRRFEVKADGGVVVELAEVFQDPPASDAPPPVPKAEGDRLDTAHLDE